MKLFYEIFWFLLPAGGANMAPVFAAKLFPSWNFPVDAGKSFQGIRIFGSHKTIRGILSGVLIATLIFVLQKHFYRSSPWIRSMSLIDYENAPFFFGPLAGLGALCGDLIKSFFKRRARVNPGVSWFPFDQIDWMLGYLIVSYPFAQLGVSFIVLAILTALVLSLVVKCTGYILRLEKTPL